MLLTLLPGLALGIAGVAVYDQHIGISLGERASWAAGVGPRELIRELVANLPTFVFSVFGAGWLFILVLLDRIATRGRRLVLCGLAAMAVAVTAATQDQTRICALLTLPILLWSAIQAVERVPAGTLRKVTTWTFIAAVILPSTIVWAGGTYVSHLGEVLPRSI